MVNGEWSQCRFRLIERANELYQPPPKPGGPLEKLGLFFLREEPDPPRKHYLCFQFLQRALRYPEKLYETPSLCAAKPFRNVGRD